jgi:hypothetical protein
VPVPIGYLITAVLLGACTRAALWPLRSRSPVGTVVYLVGVKFNDRIEGFTAWVRSHEAWARR